jgi:nucleotide-binding universal stress UspA family protein
MQPVMLATDGSPTAERATATAIELAKLLDTELVVITVWTIP